MRFSIPGTDIGFDLDIPNPVDFANDMMNKVKDLLNSVSSAIGNFFTSAMSNIGSQFRNLISTLPRTVFDYVKDGIGKMWAGLTGRS